MRFLENLLTKNKTKTPILMVYFDLKKYKENGKTGSCEARLHPAIKKDEKLTQMINDVVDYIRDNNKMEDM